MGTFVRNNPELVKEIKSLYLGGNPAAKVANRLDIKMSQVYETLRKEGVPRRGRSREASPIPSERDTIILAMLDDGFKQYEIARALRVSRQRVHQIVRKWRK